MLMNAQVNIETRSKKWTVVNVIEIIHGKRGIQLTKKNGYTFLPYYKLEYIEVLLE